MWRERERDVYIYIYICWNNMLVHVGGGGIVARKPPSSPRRGSGSGGNGTLFLDKSVQICTNTLFEHHKF